jgi:1-deoxy-D-xylulose-5-phosphate reductoisomerase
MKKIGILGSTGSIGTQALDIIKSNRDVFSATLLTCGKSIDLLEEQIKEFNPEIVCVDKEEAAKYLKEHYPKTEVFFGKKGLMQVAANNDCHMILNSLVGMMGLEPTLAAIDAGKDIALANKETLVAGGQIVMAAARKKGVKIIPVDSEHSAIFQALQGNEGQSVKRMLLTASGGPFRNYSLEQLKDVTLEQALRHPNWTMGSKITIDSATMMNKGLEVIEAKWLFDVSPDVIEVVVHKESIIHSMVEFSDSSILAQLGLPDMRVPIAYALNYPHRLKIDLEGVDFFKLGSIHFEPVDTKVFRCLGLAIEALKQGGSYPVILNSANEVLVQFFLERKISFLDIQRKIEEALETHIPQYNLNLEDILELDIDTRRRLIEWV